MQAISKKTGVRGRSGRCRKLLSRAGRGNPSRRQSPEIRRPGGFLSFPLHVYPRRLEDGRPAGRGLVNHAGVGEDDMMPSPGGFGQGASQERECADFTEISPPDVDGEVGGREKITPFCSVLAREFQKGLPENKWFNSSVLMFMSHCSGPPENRSSAMRRFSRSIASMRSSMVPRQIRRCTSTFRCWPMR